MLSLDKLKRAKYCIPARQHKW